MDRLKIMAAQCPKTLSVSNEEHIERRGAVLFDPNDPTPDFAVEFLRKLLDFMKDWAYLFPSENSLFLKAYRDLMAMQVAFPTKKTKAKVSRKTEVPNQSSNQ